MRRLTKTCPQCRGTNATRYVDRHGNCGVCHGTLMVDADFTFQKPKPPRNMLRLRKGSFIAFAETEHRQALVKLRLTDPRMKRGRIIEVLQMWPSSIEEGKIYEESRR